MVFSRAGLREIRKGNYGKLRSYLEDLRYSFQIVNDIELPNDNVFVIGNGFLASRENEYIAAGTYRMKRRDVHEVIHRIELCRGLEDDLADAVMKSPNLERYTLSGRLRKPLKYVAMTWGIHFFANVIPAHMGTIAALMLLQPPERDVEYGRRALRRLAKYNRNM